jgi:hypothetical protein
MSEVKSGQFPLNQLVEMAEYPVPKARRRTYEIQPNAPKKFGLKSILDPQYSIFLDRSYVVATAKTIELKRRQLAKRLRLLNRVVFVLLLLVCVFFVLEEESRYLYVICKGVNSYQIPTYPSNVCNFTALPHEPQHALAYSPILAFQCLLTLCTISAAFTTVYLELVLFRLRKLHGKLASNVSFVESRRWRGMLFRFVFMIVHIPPGVNGLFTVEDLYDDKVPYSYRMLNAIAFAKFFLYIFRFFVLSGGRGGTDEAYVITTAHSLKQTKYFGMKVFFGTGPITNVGVSFLFVASVMAYLICIFERPGKNHSSYADNVLNSNHMCVPSAFLQCIFVTFCTCTPSPGGTFG